MAAQYEASIVGTGYGVTARTDSVIADVQTAVYTGDATLISVSLDALERFYAQLWTFHDQVEEAITRTGAIADLPRSDVHTGHVIEGVHSAVRVARHMVSPHHEGLKRSLVRLRRLIERNLDALYQAYAAYVTTDAEGAAQLDSVGEGLANGAFSAL